jgi:hypothetical protein
MSDVVFSGPVFNGSADSALEAFKVDLGRAVAGEAYTDVHANMRSSFRNPTGFYQSRVVKDFVRQDPRVHDNGVIYGPWLEGTSRRNAETRFKGYANFRRATASTASRVPLIADTVILSYLARMD